MRWALRALLPGADSLLQSSDGDGVGDSLFEWQHQAYDQYDNYYGYGSGEYEYGYGPSEIELQAGAPAKPTAKPTATPPPAMPGFTLSLVSPGLLLYYFLIV